MNNMILLADLVVRQSTPPTTVTSEAPSTDYYGIFTTKEKPADAQEEQKVGTFIIQSQQSNANDAGVLDQNVA